MANNLCPGKSVGALVEKDGAFLVLVRTSFPPGIAGVAGHIDDGETPEEALRREVCEEAGIEAGRCIEVFRGVLQNPCKRGYGAHEWFVFRVVDWVGEPRIMEPDKHSFVGFLTKEEIAAYVSRGDVDPAWQVLLPELGIVASS